MHDCFDNVYQGFASWFALDHFVNLYILIIIQNAKPLNVLKFVTGLQSVSLLINKMWLKFEPKLRVKTLVYTPLGMLPKIVMTL